jgi:hypothetical protein
MTAGGAAAAWPTHKMMAPTIGGMSFQPLDSNNIHNLLNLLVKSGAFHYRKEKANQQDFQPKR